MSLPVISSVNELHAFIAGCSEEKPLFPKCSTFLCSWDKDVAVCVPGKGCTARCQCGSAPSCPCI